MEYTRDHQHKKQWQMHQVPEGKHFFVKLKFRCFAQCNKIVIQMKLSLGVDAFFLAPTFVGIGFMQS